ncbi:unnamed protein product [Rotaria sp. Silwood1]|nr:unnamed protein product [Rotaria sp. Silwood1]
MTGCFERNAMIEEYVDELLNTFRTPFWLDERGWFVRCDWDQTDSNILLYTLPYAFDYFCVFNSKIGKSTCPQENNQWSYDAARQLTYYVKSEKYSHLSDIQFCKVDSLKIRFPVSDYFWSMISTFDHLTSCEIMLDDTTEECKKQLQLLLSRASRLSFLGLSKFSPTSSIENLPLETMNVSIKRLDLKRLHESYDEEQCMKFSHSHLAMQCEELHISVKYRISICHLVKTMHNLRLLYVKCEENEQKRYSIEDNKQDQSSTENKLVNWLEQQLSGVRSVIEISDCCGTIVLRIS